MSSVERQEAIKALSQLATMYHMSSPKDSLRADPTAIRLRNRAAVLQLSTHANITEEEAAERYYQQQGQLEMQRRNEANIERLRNSTNGGVPYDYNQMSSMGNNTSSPLSGGGSSRRHYMSRRLGDGGAGSPSNVSFGSYSGSPLGGGGGGFDGSGAGGVGSAYPPPPVSRDSAVGAVESLVTLANSYAATGRFTDAVRVIKRAIAFAENQFKPVESEGQRSSKASNNQLNNNNNNNNNNKFRKTNTQTSHLSSAPTVSSIHSTPLAAGGGGGASSSSPTARRVGFSDDRQQQQGPDQYNIEVLKGIYDNNASFGNDDGDAGDHHNGSSALFFGGSGGDDNNAYVNQPQLVPLLVLLSNYLDAEGSRHEAQCTRDRIRGITEDIQGIGVFDYTRGRTNPRDDYEAMGTILRPVNDQFDDREELLEMASPDHRRRVAEELLQQRTGGGGGGNNNNSSRSVMNGSRGGAASDLNLTFLSSSSASPLRNARMQQKGDASPGSVAYVRNKNFYKY